MFQHNTHYRAVASIPICVNVTSAAIGNPWGLDSMETSHTILPAENDAQKIKKKIYIYIIYT
jgi:hypothetical protein